MGGGHIAENPKKIVHVSNLHLVQSIIGRGLFALSLEWWYVNFPPHDIYMFCMESMKDGNSDGRGAADSVSDLSGWLGLPPYDYSEAVSAGVYNVGGHRGYGEATSWNESERLEDLNDDAHIPLSDSVREEFYDFVAPFNERLFDLTGRRCADWPS